MFDVGRPEHICSGLKERGQLRQMLRARATLHTAAHKDITPVYFDPEVRIKASGKKNIRSLEDIDAVRAPPALVRCIERSANRRGDIIDKREEQF